MSHEIKIAGYTAALRGLYFARHGFEPAGVKVEPCLLGRPGAQKHGVCVTLVCPDGQHVPPEFARSMLADNQEFAMLTLVGVLLEELEEPESWDES